MQPVSFFALLLFDHVETVSILFVGPAVEFLFPGGLFSGNIFSAFFLVAIADQRFVMDTSKQRGRAGAGVATNSD